MQQENEKRKGERVITVHSAGSWTEAVVLRGLLASAGIHSPAPTTADPFPLREYPVGTYGVEILVLESQADEARQIIAEYLEGGRAAGAVGQGDG